MEFNDPIKIYDARWEENEFSDREIKRLCEAILLYAKELGIENVTISRDTRLGASKVMEIMKETALYGGFRVFMCCAPISTPHSYFFTLRITEKYPQTMGITITASHNPADYIGMKVTVPPVRAIGLESGPNGGFKRIREIYHSNQLLPKNDKGKLTLLNLTEEYINFSLEAAGVKEQSLEGISVILDSFNGSAGPELYMVLDKSGINIEALKLIPDGRFPSGPPNPIGRGKMLQAIEIAKSIENSVIIGTDGDGDRLVFGDRRGIFTSGTSSIPIFKILTKEKSNHTLSSLKVIYDPKVNPQIIGLWREMGIIPYPFRNGHSQIKEYMRKIDAIGAVEESGHFYHRTTYRNITTYSENSIITTLLFLKAFHQNKNLMNELWELQKHTFTTGEFNYKFENETSRDNALKEIVKFFRDQGAKIQSKTDDGIDLQGYLVTGKGENLFSKGLSHDWYSGYFRISTNEKSVLRSYITASTTEIGMTLEKQIRRINSSFEGIETE